MKRVAIWFAAFFTLAAAGCGGTMSVNAYGRSGKAYAAPSLCAAILACRAAGETSCYYDETLITYPDSPQQPQYSAVCVEAGTNAPQGKERK